MNKIWEYLILFATYVFTFFKGIKYGKLEYKSKTSDNISEFLDSYNECLLDDETEYRD